MKQSQAFDMGSGGCSSARCYLVWLRPRSTSLIPNVEIKEDRRLRFNCYAYPLIPTPTLVLVYGVRMASGVETTKCRIREAAVAEFAEHGQHGTTIDRVAARAGVNRERVYHYFGDKEALFAAVVREEAEEVAAAVPPKIERVEDFGEIAGRTFDYQQTHPDLARLVVWEGLADTGAVADELGRSALYQSKVEAIAAAQRKGLINDAVSPAHLVFMLIALASWWDAAPQIARMLSGADPADPDERTRRRAAVVEAAQRLAQPRDSPDG